jgi:pSer/pThr/pTyr-binding forkhead associated (FHA) protein
MAKLVILSEGMTGRSHELTVDKTTIGRVEDNTFPIMDPSVSSHHCEVILRGTDVVVHDLNSTNGTFIEGEKVSESVLKPGQILRLGQIQLRLEPVPSGAPAGNTPAKKNPADSTMMIPRGVSLNDLEQGGRSTGFGTSSKGFSKKTNKTNIVWILISVVAAIVIGVLLLIAFTKAQ